MILEVDKPRVDVKKGKEAPLVGDRSIGIGHPQSGDRCAEISSSTTPIGCRRADSLLSPLSLMLNCLSIHHLHRSLSPLFFILTRDVGKVSVEEEWVLGGVENFFSDFACLSG